MKDYLDEMLHLTADIAEQLLEIKDSDGTITPGLCKKINNLAALANDNEMQSHSEAEVSVGDYLEQIESEAATCNESSPLPEMDDDSRIEELTDNIIRSEIEELRNDVAEDEASGDETDVATPEPGEEESALEAEVERARREAEESEEDEAVTEINDAAEDVEALEESDAKNAESIAESSEFEEAEDADVDEPGENSSAPVSNVSADMLRRSFTLNDIFLYQRTLFGGSAQRFNAALRAIATMHGIDEVKEFLADSERINLRSDDAKEFVATLSQFFN